MLTVIYCGAGEYKLHFDTMTVVLSETQIVEITNYVNESDINTDRSDEQEKLNDWYDEKIELLTERVSDLRSSLQLIADEAEKELENEST